MIRQFTSAFPVDGGLESSDFITSAGNKMDVVLHLPEILRLILRSVYYQTRLPAR